MHMYAFFIFKKLLVYSPACQPWLSCVRLHDIFEIFSAGGKFDIVMVCLAQYIYFGDLNMYYKC